MQRYLAPVPPRTVGLIAIVGLLVAFATNLAIVWLGETFLDVPHHLRALEPMALIPATVLPVAGNCFGCYMSWRTPNRASLPTFLAVAAVMTVVGIAISASLLPAGASAGSMITTSAIAIAPVLVIVPTLLHLVSNHAPRK